MTFGFSGNVDHTLKSWVPKLRQLLSRVTILESDNYGERDTPTTKIWLGKPVFRKVVDIGSLPNNSTNDIDHGLGEFERVISIQGFASDGTSIVPLPYPTFIAAQAVRIVATSTLVRVSTTFDWSDYTGFIVLEYTRP